jgi:hypothetical protein
MEELTLDGKKYVSSKRAAEITGYAKDYIGQMCREGRVEARQVGRAWYVLESALRHHRFGKAKEETKTKVVEVQKEVEIKEIKPVSVVTNTWEAPRYHSETPEFMAEIKKPEAVEGSESINLLNSEPEIASDRKDPLKDLQSAWKEWFAVKQTPELEPEHLLADHEEGHVRSEDGSVISTAYSSVETPLASYSPVYAPEDGFIESEAVSIPIARLTDKVEIEEKEKLDEIAVYKKQKTSRKARRSGRGLGGLVLVIRTVLIVVAVISIFIGVIGTGVAHNYIPKSYQTSVLSQIEGVSSFKK